MTTGERIKEARLKAGLTQQELAEKIGVKFSAVHKYESGLVVNLKRETIAALATALNVKPSWLMCMDEEKPAPVQRELADTEKELLDLFNLLPEADQKAALSLIRSLLNSRGLL